MYTLTSCMSLEKCLFKSFACFLNWVIKGFFGLFVFYSLVVGFPDISWRLSPYQVRYGFQPDIYKLQTFSPLPLVAFFTLLIVFFAVQNL